ncbi:hypothetical protein ACFSLT_23235 [Novosphingobium resinovorum]
MSIEPATELLDREPLPAPRFADEADAIAAAHEAAARIAAISADPAERSRIPHEQSAILERSGVTTVALSPRKAASARRWRRSSRSRGSSRRRTAASANWCRSTT